MSPSEPRIPLPKSWPIHVRVAILHVIALAQFATAHTRSWAANSVNARIRLQAERDRAVQELALQREETRGTQSPLEHHKRWPSIEFRYALQISRYNVVFSRLQLG